MAASLFIPVRNVLFRIFLNMQDLLTIIIPALNEDQYLDDCLKSIYNQTYRNFRLICINDGSTDNTGSILTLWKKKFGPGMTIISHRKNFGFTNSLNEGLSLVRTPWTGRVDADDYWHPEKLQKQMDFLQSHPKVKLIGCNYMNISQHKSGFVRLPETDSQIREYLPKGNPFGHSCVLFDTKLVKDLGGYSKDYYPSDDYELWFRISGVGQMHNLQTPLCYRRLGDGISLVSQNKQLKSCLRIQHRIISERNLPFIYYFHLLPTFLTLITPNWMRSMKRKLLG